MSFIRITTIHPTGREISGITQQAHVTAREAFDRRLTRAKVANQPHSKDVKNLTIQYHPTDIVDYSQVVEHADTIGGFDDGGQLGLFEVTP